MAAIATFTMKDGSEYRFGQEFFVSWTEDCGITASNNTRNTNNFNRTVDSLFSPGKVFVTDADRLGDEGDILYRITGGREVVAGRDLNAYIATDTGGVLRVLPAEEIRGVSVSDSDPAAS